MHGARSGVIDTQIVFTIAFRCELPSTVLKNVAALPNISGLQVRTPPKDGVLELGLRHPRRHRDGDGCHRHRPQPDGGQHRQEPGETPGGSQDIDCVRKYSRVGRFV